MLLVVEAVPTRTAKDGMFLVNVTASATDPDGDVVTLEYADTASDSYYAVGTHTIRVRAKDDRGSIFPMGRKDLHRDQCRTHRDPDRRTDPHGERRQISCQYQRQGSGCGWRRHHLGMG